MYAAIADTLPEAESCFRELLQGEESMYSTVQYDHELCHGSFAALHCIPLTFISIMISNMFFIDILICDIKGRAASVGPVHVYTVEAAAKLEEVLSRLKKWTALEKVLNDQADARRSGLGLKHCDTLRAIRDLGDFLATHGSELETSDPAMELNKAEKLLLEALCGFREPLAGRSRGVNDLMAALLSLETLYTGVEHARNADIVTA